MPTHRQLLTVPAAKGGNASIGTGLFAPGSADYAAMRLMYPGSPAYDGTYDDDKAVSTYLQTRENPVSDGGVTFGTVNIDYSDAPDLRSVQTGGGGLPGTPYSPTPASPGPGMNFRNIPTIPADKIHKGGGGFGQGDGLASPSDTSRVISSQKLGNLMFGTSKPR